MKTEIVNCDFCGCSENTVIWNKIERKNQGLLEHGYFIHDVEGNMLNAVNVMCNFCGLVYTNPRVIQEDMDNYYNEDYRKTFKTNMNGEATHSNGVMQFLNTHPICKGLKGKSLDIGCSYGFIVKALSQVFDSWGIDQNEIAVKTAQENGLQVVKSNLYDFDGENFNLITIVNTLEHIHSPTMALNKIRTLLSDDGYLLIVVPDLYTYTLMCGIDGFMSCAHLYQFDARTISLLLKKCGFEVVTAHGIFEPNFGKLYVVAKKTTRTCDETIKINYRPDAEVLKTRLNAFDFLSRSMVRYKDD